MNKSYIEWLDYYENATKEDVIQDMMLDINSIKEKNKEIERLNNIIKDIKKCIDYYAIENDDFSKFYNNEEIEILNIIGSDKVE